jgi:hypothetical protein
VYTSVLRELAGLRFEITTVPAPGLEPETSLLMQLFFCIPVVIILAPLAEFFKQYDLKFLAPASPPPRKPRQNSRPRTVPPKKPLSSASGGSTVRKKECVPESVCNDSRVRDVSDRTERTEQD